LSLGPSDATCDDNLVTQNASSIFCLIIFRDLTANRRKKESPSEFTAGSSKTNKPAAQTLENGEKNSLSSSGSRERDETAGTWHQERSPRPYPLGTNHLTCGIYKDVVLVARRRRHQSGKPKRRPVGTSKSRRGPSQKEQSTQFSARLLSQQPSNLWNVQRRLSIWICWTKTDITGKESTPPSLRFRNVTSESNLRRTAASQSTKSTSAPTGLQMDKLHH
jgi:hypothetical protein